MILHVFQITCAETDVCPTGRIDNYATALRALEGNREKVENKTRMLPTYRRRCLYEELGTLLLKEDPELLHSFVLRARLIEREIIEPNTSATVFCVVPQAAVIQHVSSCPDIKFLFKKRVDTLDPWLLCERSKTLITSLTARLWTLDILAPLRLELPCLCKQLEEYLRDWCLVEMECEQPRES
ncbi:hypothetical protein NLJ89_g1369 [Agrocybe chaxingu]|uniref:Uncharacterized protein n=1 Tax=Agrocybe chaxingu TaxID=84603 RepID=A0A9W8TFA6_9AGAR|nr:hypothetical protein NLJ89_g1369 [Agrocybe chaxingu]